MKLLAYIAASLAVLFAFATLVDADPAKTNEQAQGTSARSQASVPAAAGADGLSLAGFADAWSLRQAVQTGPEQLPELTEAAQRRRRVAGFMARMLPPEPTAPAMRPGDRVGLRDGDRQASRKNTAPFPQVDEAAERIRAEQRRVSVKGFHARMEQRLAQADASKDSSWARPAIAAGGRPGDTAGARAGDLASLQRKHP